MPIRSLYLSPGRDDAGNGPRVFRPTSGAAPHMARVAIGGHPFEVRGWTLTEWADVAERDRPGEAFRLGTMGFVWIGPAD